jgi:hypothetical protein
VPSADSGLSKSEIVSRFGRLEPLNFLVSEWRGFAESASAPPRPKPQHDSIAQHEKRPWEELPEQGFACSEAVQWGVNSIQRNRSRLPFSCRRRF